MGDALSVHESDRVDHLLKVVAGNGLTEGTCVANEVEQLASCGELKHNEVGRLVSLLGVFLRVNTAFNHADDVRVREFLQG